MHLVATCFLPQECLDCPSFMEEVLGSRWSHPHPCWRLSCPCTRLALVPTCQVDWDGAALEKAAWWSSVMKCEEPPWPTLPFHLGAVFKLGPLPERHHECAFAWYDPCWSWPSDLTSQSHLQPAELSGNLDSWLTLFCHDWPCCTCLFGHSERVPLVRSLPCLPTCNSSGCTCSCCSWQCKSAHLGACTQVVGLLLINVLVAFKMAKSELGFTIFFFCICVVNTKCKSKKESLLHLLQMS